MARPSVAPTFATAATFPAGALDWSSQPPRVQPSGAILAQGFTPAADLPAEYLNFMFGNQGDWLSYLDASQSLQIFGIGVDGAVVLDGATSFAGFSTKVGSVYTLTRDVFFTNLTINTGVTLVCAGFRVYGNGTLTTVGTGAISASGAAAVGSTPGAAGASGTTGSGSVGGSTSTTVGVAGTGSTNSYGGNGALGGLGTSGGGGLAAVAQAPVASAGAAYIFNPATVGNAFGAGAWVKLTGGAGGSGGGGDGANTGAAGGAGGGVLCVIFRTLSLAASTSLIAAGGNGGNAAAGNTGGGSSGGGGTLFVAYLINASGTVFSAAVNCPAGAAGTSHGTGGAAGGSFVGSVFEFQLALAAVNPTVITGTHAESGIALFTSGGSGAGFDFVDIVFSAPFTTATGSNGYKHTTDVYISDAGGHVDVDIINKTTTGMRIRPVDQFNGEVSWSVST